MNVVLGISHLDFACRLLRVAMEERWIPEARLLILQAAEVHLTEARKHLTEGS